MIPFRRLDAWQAAHALILEIYDATASFPREERFGLTSQLRRAAISTATNVAEGAGRQTDRDRARFVSIAIGSNAEVDALLLVARDLGFMNSELHRELQTQVDTVRRLLAGYHRFLISNGRR